MSIVDHVPADDTTRPTMRDAYSRMRSLYEEVYGAPDPRIWTDVVATCGDSYSGFIPPADEFSAEVDPFV